jgi:hypothetical protein
MYYIFFLNYLIWQITMAYFYSFTDILSIIYICNNVASCTGNEFMQFADCSAKLGTVLSSL